MIRTSGIVFPRFSLCVMRFVLCVLVLILYPYSFLHASGLPFGGIVTTVPQSTTPSATCTGTSFSINPTNGAPAGPYYISVPLSGPPSPAGGILGTYAPSVGPCCIPSSAGCTPVTTYLVQTYGVGGGGGNYNSDSTSSVLGGDTGGGGDSTSQPSQRTSGGGNSGSATGSDNIRRGSSGESVRQLQKSLNTALKTNLAEDGIFGEKTLRAVIDFQKSRGLSPDGIAGPKTKAELLLSM